ncbi:MAG: metallophosphoesterase [Candidatus Nanoarchaeia archaeon]|nr:metallophosphoesterase [Candidatus Nanoarchaeia archaeon]
MKPQINIKFLEDSLLINKEILVLSDVHIGYEEYLYRESLFQRMQLKEIIKKLTRIFDYLDKEKIFIKKIIILGDLKHEFGEISDAEWRETLYVLDFLSSKIKLTGRNKNKEKIILIKGNHDTILGPIARKKDIQLKDYYKIKKFCFLHGNKLYKDCLKNSNILVLGHLHPSITLSDEYKREKYKCFLKGKWKNKQVYILPSFSDISFGYDLRLLNEEKHSDGFLIIPSKTLNNFKVIIYNNKENQEYDFGKLKGLIKN